LAFCDAPNVGNLGSPSAYSLHSGAAWRRMITIHAIVVRATAAVVGIVWIFAASIVAEGRQLEASSARLRALHPRVKQLLVDGQNGSWTFARLIDDLGQSNVIVLIDVRPDIERSDPHLVGALQFMAYGGGQRYLRVCLYAYGAAHEFRWIATLAHELQHALEVAHADSVENEETFTALYRKIASDRRGDVFETSSAREIERQVLLELCESTRRNRRSASLRQRIDDGSR
jgi:hypothetical protein